MARSDDFSRRIIFFVQFFLFFICIGYLNEEVKLSTAFVEFFPTQGVRYIQNAQNIKSASILDSTRVLIELPRRKDSTYSNSFQRHEYICSYRDLTSRMMQRKNDDPNDKSVFSSSNSEVEVAEKVPKTRIKDVPLRIKAKALSLYTGVSKRIVYTKKILLNVAPSFLFLSRIRRKSTTAIRATEIKSDSIIKESNNLKTSMSTATISTPLVPPPRPKITPTLKSPTILSDPPISITPKPTIESNPKTDQTIIIPSKKTQTKNRFETCHPNINLNGKWSVVVSPKLKKEYDDYLLAFRQPALFRAVALNVLSMTKEQLEQNDDGTEFTIRGTNPRGVWERTLISSGYSVDWENENNQNESSSLSSLDLETFEPKYTMIQNAGGADVEAECWWEENGSVHVSWVRNAKEGDFYSRRYIDEDGYYICESSFYHNEKSKVFYGLSEDVDLKKRVAYMSWKFQREE